VVEDNFALMYIWYKDQPPLPKGTERHVTFVAERWYPAVEEKIASRPQLLSLDVAPNPFSSELKIAFSLTTSSEIEIAVYDISGRLVTRLLSGSTQAGRHTLTWKGTDRAGRKVPAGIYFVKLSGATSAVVKKIVIAR